MALSRTTEDCCHARASAAAHPIELQLEGVALLCTVFGADGRAVHIHEHEGAVVRNYDSPFRVQALQLALRESAGAAAESGLYTGAHDHRDHESW